MGERIGILGGTFNPIHTGHLILAQDACERFDLDKVYFVPAGQPPHKRTAHLLAAEDRLAMLKLGVQGDNRFEVHDDEIVRGGVSYSIDTVRRLAGRRPGAKLFFIVGGDTLPELHTWKDVGELVKLCEFVTIARPGLDVAALTPDYLRLPANVAAQLIKNVFVGHLCEISSTDVRQRAARGLSIRYLVPETVERYILQRNLYPNQETKP